MFFIRAIILFLSIILNISQEYYDDYDYMPVYSMRRRRRRLPFAYRMKRMLRKYKLFSSLSLPSLPSLDQLNHFNVK